MIEILALLGGTAQLIDRKILSKEEYESKLKSEQDRFDQLPHHIRQEETLRKFWSN